MGHAKDREYLRKRDARVNDIREVARELHRAFHWSDSPQGHEYWNNIYETLMALAIMEGGGHVPSENRFRVLIACQNSACAEEVTYHLDMMRMLDGKPICETCYAEDVVVGEDGEYGTDWNDLPPVRFADLCE